MKDVHGYVKVLAREDDVINVAGHRLSTSALEEAVMEHPDVVDCAVIGIPDELKGQIPMAFYIKRGKHTYFPPMCDFFCHWTDLTSSSRLKARTWAKDRDQRSRIAALIDMR